VIVPVPLHPRRIAQRGFNQSALLAAEVARRHVLPLDTGVLRRVVDTAPQVRQARSERLRSLRSAFAVRRRDRIAGAGVVLLDDVVTTTATVRAASAALIEAGAAWVNVISLARAEWPDRIADRGQTR
jgi:ComF family protein